MARSIVVRMEGEESAFAFVKVEREKLYGKKQRVVVDEQNRTCQSAWLTADGSALVPTGGTAHVWIDESWSALEQEARLPVDEQGSALETKPSTLGIAQEGRIADTRRVLDYLILFVYQLSPETLAEGLQKTLGGGAIVDIPFRFRDGFEQDAMFVLQNEEGTFALVGRPTGFAPLAREQLPLTIEPGGDDADELSDDLDFSMM